MSPQPAQAEPQTARNLRLVANESGQVEFSLILSLNGMTFERVVTIVDPTVDMKELVQRLVENQDHYQAILNINEHKGHIFDYDGEIQYVVAEWYTAEQEEDYMAEVDSIGFDAITEAGLKYLTVEPYELEELDVEVFREE